MSEEKKSNGRPTKYKKEFKEQVYKLCLLGATDKQIADFFGVCEDTINNWKKTEDGFFVSIKKGKLQADSEIASSLFHRAKGYEHQETKVFNNMGDIVTYDMTKHYAPDPTAIIFWLKNRQPELWRDKQEIENSGKLNLVTEVKTNVNSEDTKENLDNLDDM